MPLVRPKVFLTKHWPDQVEQYLAERYDLTINMSDAPLSDRELHEAIGAFEAVCPTVSDRISAAVLTGDTHHARILGNYGVGVSHIDLKACRQAGIMVTNTPDVLTDCTADLAIALMMMVARRAGEGERLVRSRAWTGWTPTHLLGTRVSGKTLGLIGFGRIGQAVAHRASLGFGMRVIYHSRRRATAEIESPSRASYCESLERLLADADFVSLHCPGGSGTRHLLGARQLSQMKPSAILINTSRGEVIDEQALADALRCRVIAGAGLDVYENEPQIEECLCALENLVILPHLGSATVETRVAMGMRVAQNLDRFFAGLEPPDRVD